MNCILIFNNKLQEVPHPLRNVEPFVIWNAIVLKVQINFLVIIQSRYKNTDWSVERYSKMCILVTVVFFFFL
jgi:hypothetical protein